MGKKKNEISFYSIFLFFLIGGFAFLPLLWLINAIWFYKQAFKVEPYPQQAEIRKCKYNNFIKFLFIYLF